MSGISQKITLSILASLVLVAGGYVMRDVLCPPISAAIEYCSIQGKKLLNQDASEPDDRKPGQLADTTEIGPRYYEYSPRSLELAHQLSDTVILYFWAPWCTTCSTLDLEIEKNPEIIPQDAVVLRIPYDTAADLKKKYAVTIQHTFVLLNKNNEALNLVVGGDPADVLLAP